MKAYRFGRDLARDDDAEPDFRLIGRAPAADLGEVRRRYPEAGPQGANAPYCVVGALLGHLGLDEEGEYAHPSATQAAAILHGWRPDVFAAPPACGWGHGDPECRALQRVMHANDDGDVEAAWGLLAEVLVPVEAAEYAEVMAWREVLEPAPGPWLPVEVAREEGACVA